MEMKIKGFKELTNTELYRMLKLRSEVFVLEQECPYLDPDGADEICRHLYLEEDGEMIGCLRILPKGVTFPQVSIGRVAVAKAWRGKGLSRDMMTAAMDFVWNEMKETEIQISAQAYLLGFYGSLGFRRVSEEYLEDGIPHIDMICHREG